MSAGETVKPPNIETYNSGRRKWRWFIVSLVTVILAVAAVVLFNFEPSHASIYPVCVFKKMTGWSCPACGCLRATHQLLHGHVATAFALNPLYIVALPFLALLGVEQLLRKTFIPKPPVLGWTALAIFIGFGILRNLPPFLPWSGQ